MISQVSPAAIPLPPVAISISLPKELKSETLIYELTDDE